MMYSMQTCGLTPAVWTNVNNNVSIIQSHQLLTKRAAASVLSDVYVFHALTFAIIAALYRVSICQAGKIRIRQHTAPLHQ